MFAGKTSELLRRVRRHRIAKRKCTLIKHKSDTRYSSNKITTHDKQSSCNRHKVHATTLLDDVNETLLNESHVIAIDEGQFFVDLAAFCETWANRNKIVIVSGLDADFQRNAFTSMIELVPLAEMVTKMCAVCYKCGRDASFSQRYESSPADSDSSSSEEQQQQMMVGGSEIYRATCRQCYFDH